MERSFRIALGSDGLEASEVVVSKKPERTRVEIFISELNARGKWLQIAHVIRHPGLMWGILELVLPYGIESDVKIVLHRECHVG